MEAASSIGAVGQGAPPEVADLLRKASSYLEHYEATLSGVVAEEDYLQEVRAGGEALARRLRSDIVMIPDQEVGIIEFRDVFEVDGRAVRDRSDRLASLFINPTSEANAQARRIVDEGARFNLNPTSGNKVARSINTPLLALRYLRTREQHRSQFSLDRRRSDPSGLTVTFSERDQPRIISSSDGAPGRGWFRIEPSTGRVTASELRILTGALTATVRVQYAEVAAVGLWMPQSMDERYELGPGGGFVQGGATYTNFRRYQVSTSTTIKK